MARERNPKLGYIDINEYGVSLVLRQRRVGGSYYLDCAEGRRGERDRHSTGFSDPQHACRYAIDYCLEVARERLGDAPPPPPEELTLGHLFDEFRKSRLPRLRPGNAKGYDMLMRVAESVLGREQLVSMIDQDSLDELADRRRAGGIVVTSADGEGETRTKPAGQGLVRADYRHLNAILNWATKKSTGPGTWLLEQNPLSRLDRPDREKNPRQPISDQYRFSVMVNYADQVDPTGRMKLILYIARYTGRRIGEICQLRCSDVLLDADMVRAALADRGDERFPDSNADLWKMGLRWPETSNKQGLHWVVPMGPVLAGAIREYLLKTPNPTVGDVPLFPAERNNLKPIAPDLVSKWFRKVETIALQEGHKTPHLRGGRWHPLRRLFRTEKKKARFDAKDVFFVAGWSYTDPNAGNHGYLHYDAEDLLDVVCHELPPDPIHRQKRRRLTA